jgi:hypothetical protein
MLLRKQHDAEVEDCSTRKNDAGWGREYVFERGI